MRDPQKLGENLQTLSQGVFSLRETYDRFPLSMAESDEYARNEGPVEKYGRAGEVEPLYMEVQVR